MKYLDSTSSNRAAILTRTFTAIASLVPTLRGWFGSGARKINLDAHGIRRPKTVIAALLLAIAEAIADWYHALLDVRQSLFTVPPLPKGTRWVEHLVRTYQDYGLIPYGMAQVEPPTLDQLQVFFSRWSLSKLTNTTGLGLARFDSSRAKPGEYDLKAIIGDDNAVRLVWNTTTAGPYLSWSAVPFPVVLPDRDAGDLTVVSFVTGDPYVTGWTGPDVRLREAILVAGTGRAINVSTGGFPLKLHFPAGLQLGEPLFRVESTADVTGAWTNLPQAETVFLYGVRVAPGQIAWSHSLLEPAYGPVAPEGPDTDQHWFDTLNRIWKRWDGTAWEIPLGRAFLGEATIGASGINRIRNYLTENPEWQREVLERGAGLSATLLVRDYPINFHVAQGLSTGQPNTVLRTIGETRPGAWKDLDPESRCYLYVDFSDPDPAKPAFGFSRLQPVFAVDAPPLPDLDQHWFDLGNFWLKRWDGATWVAQARVFVGEAITSADGVVQLYNWPLTQVQVALPGNSGLPGTYTDRVLVGYGSTAPGVKPVSQVWETDAQYETRLEHYAEDLIGVYQRQLVTGDTLARAVALAIDPTAKPKAAEIPGGWRYKNDTTGVVLVEVLEPYQLLKRYPGPSQYQATRFPGETDTSLAERLKVYQEWHKNRIRTTGVPNTPYPVPAGEPLIYQTINEGVLDDPFNAALIKTPVSLASRRIRLLKQELGSYTNLDGSTSRQYPGSNNRAGRFEIHVHTAVSDAVYQKIASIRAAGVAVAIVVAHWLGEATPSEGVTLDWDASEAIDRVDAGETDWGQPALDAGVI